MKWHRHRWAVVYWGMPFDHPNGGQVQAAIRKCVCCDKRRTDWVGYE